MSDLRTEFERLHCGGNPHLIRRDSTTRDYVLPSINDAWAGFQSGHAAGLEQQAKRIAELEASLADSDEALQILGLKLAHAEADVEHKNKMIAAGSRRDECKINLIKKQNEQIAELKKKLRYEYADAMLAERNK